MFEDRVKMILLNSGKDNKRPAITDGTCTTQEGNYMTDILIVAATLGEVEFLIGKSGKNRSRSLFSIVNQPNLRIDLLITGVGIAATTYHLTRQMAAHSYSLIMNVGIAGTLDPELKPVRLVRVMNDRFADFGVDDRGIFRDAGEIGLHKPNSFPFRKGLLKPTCSIKPASFKLLIPANGITVQTVTGSNKSAKKLVEKYGPAVESMEGAAVFYTAMMERVDCVQVRSISNLVTNRKRESWKTREAIDALEGFVTLLLTEFAYKG